MNGDDGKAVYWLRMLQTLTKIDSEMPFDFWGYMRSIAPQQHNSPINSTKKKNLTLKKVFHFNKNRPKGVTESLLGASLTGEDAFW